LTRHGFNLSYHSNPGSSFEGSYKSRRNYQSLNTFSGSRACATIRSLIQSLCLCTAFYPLLARLCATVGVKSHATKTSRHEATHAFSLVIVKRTSEHPGSENRAHPPGSFSRRHNWSRKRFKTVVICSWKVVQESRNG